MKIVQPKQHTIDRTIENKPNPETGYVEMQRKRFFLEYCFPFK